MPTHHEANDEFLPTGPAWQPRFYFGPALGLMIQTYMHRKYRQKMSSQILDIKPLIQLLFTSAIYLPIHTLGPFVLIPGIRASDCSGLPHWIRALHEISLLLAFYDV